MFTGASVVCALLLLLQRWHQETVLSTLNWFNLGTQSFDASLVLSDRSILMLAVVAFISFLVHLYSTIYMKGDEGWQRYFAMLGFFTFSMQGIVLSDNLLFVFIFWELVGFSSYMLIGHWTHKREAGRAASKAFIMNRIGDAGFLVGLMIIWATQNTFSLTALFEVEHLSAWQTAAGLCIFCGVIGKSAQFPLFTWLPDAMEGPTPVSALIHAATMVAAGVYLLVRIFNLFTEDALMVVAITGMITAVTGACAALSQFDIKKILAYSTMSQLGLMVLALGMGAVDAAFLHLLTHAFFKACLFLSAGNIIHALHAAEQPNVHFDVQDIRHMGGLHKRLPATFMTFAISAASLAGVPFFSGFLSKEAMLTTLFMHDSLLSWLMIAALLAVSFLTVIYAFRVVWFVFLGEPRTIRPLTITEPEWRMRLPVAVLAAGSLWFMVSLNPFDFEGWIMEAPQPSPYAFWITLFSVVWVAGAALLSWQLFRTAKFRVSTLLRNAFYVDAFYTQVVAKSTRIASRIADTIDRRAVDRLLHGFIYGQVIFAHVVGWIDRTFVDGTVNATARLTGWGGKFTRSFQGGNVQLYIFWSLFAIIIFIIWAL